MSERVRKWVKEAREAAQKWYMVDAEDMVHDGDLESQATYELEDKEGLTGPEWVALRGQELDLIDPVDMAYGVLSKEAQKFVAVMERAYQKREGSPWEDGE